MTLYRLTFPNGKSYIGITSVTLRRRLILHKNHAKKEVRGPLQRAIRKYGFESMKVEVLMTAVSWEELCELEKAAIVKFNTQVPNGYNVTMGGEGAFGVQVSDERRRGMRERMKGKPFLGGRPKGWKHSEEARRKITKAGIGRVFSEETRAKMGATKVGNTFNVGRPCRDETKLKISSAQKGRVFSEEHKANIKAAAQRRASR